MAGGARGGAGAAGGATGPARAPLLPTFVGNTTTTIVIDFDENDNNVVVEFAVAIYSEAGSLLGWIKQSDGSTVVAEDWSAKATWTSLISCIGLTELTGYKFKVKARNEVDVETALSAFSVLMMTEATLAYSPYSNDYTLECSEAFTKASAVSISGTSQEVDIKYTLKRNISKIISNDIALINANPDTITSATVNFETEGFQAGQTLEIKGSTADDADDYTIDTVSGGTITLDAGDTLIGESAGDNNITLESQSLSSVNMQFSKDWSPSLETGSWSNCTEGATGDGESDLTTSASGVVHAFSWKTCTDLGNSYHSSTIYVRVKPYDGATSGAGTHGADADSPSAATIDNRPLSVTLAEINGFAYDPDTTPVVIAEMASVVCGTALYFELEVWAGASLVYTILSSEVLTGWEYERVYNDGNWYAPTGSGVPADTYVGTNQRIKYTFQTSTILTAGTSYKFKMRQGEVVNVT